MTEPRDATEEAVHGVVSSQKDHGVQTAKEATFMTKFSQRIPDLHNPTEAQWSKHSSTNPLREAHSLLVRFGATPQTPWSGHVFRESHTT